MFTGLESCYNVVEGCVACLHWYTEGVLERRKWFTVSEMIFSYISDKVKNDILCLNGLHFASITRDKRVIFSENQVRI